MVDTCINNTKMTFAEAEYAKMREKENKPKRKERRTCGNTRYDFSVFERNRMKMCTVEVNVANTIVD